MLARRGVDTRAANAVFGQEGLSGGIGDSGHAFGPGQFNDVGGVWTGRYPGLSAQQKNALAWSEPGLRELATRVAAVAGGLHGSPAVQAIVRRFERPADPAGEIARALAGGLREAPVGLYGQTSGLVPEPGPQAPAQHFGGYLDPSILQSILSMSRESVGLPPLELPMVTPQPTPSGPQATVNSSIELRNGPSARAFKGRGVRALERFASPYGLTVTSTTGGKHAPGSYHYLGRAVDFGGAPVRMAALAEHALHTGGFKEVIYTGPGNNGFSILRGKVVPNSSLSPSLFAQHTNHVHLAR